MADSEVQERNQEVKTPWGTMGYLVYKRTYSRGDEEFPQTVDRIIRASNQQLDCGFSREESEDLRSILLGLEGSVAGRFWWQLGTRTVRDLGLASLQNCAGTVVDHPITPFTWAFDMLMLGSGVGYNIQREHVSKLPKVKRAKITRKDTNDADFIVPDNREGWVSLLGKVLKAHFYGKGIKSYSTVCIRGKGAPIKGFGGVASGPEALCEGIEKINKVLNNRAGKFVRPIDCLDIMNIIGSIVIAGNVRRSAQLALGDYDDIEFLQAKRWDLGGIPNWRAMSNNSVVCSDTSKLTEDFWAGYQGKGEPYGLINLELSREIGRIGETEYPDKKVVITNPCGEQSLEKNETCCLAELFLPNIKSEERLFEVIKPLYRINKHSLNMACHQKDTEEIVNKNMRMGIGVTGYLQATEEQRGWLPAAYVKLREYDKQYSKLHGFPESIKLTTVKPSGTLSLLAGVTAGVHPAYARHYIRRVCISAESPLISVCQKNGYKIEPRRNFDGTDDMTTMVVEFLDQVPEGTPIAAETTAIKQLDVVRRLQREWSDNAVSCTVYYKQEELGGIKEYLKDHYTDELKSVSFLLHSDHGFDQAPYEEISKKEYERRVLLVTPLTGIQINDEDMEIQGCRSGACPVR